MSTDHKGDAVKRQERLTLTLVEMLAGEDAGLVAVALDVAWNLPAFTTPAERAAAVHKALSEPASAPQDRYRVFRLDGQDAPGHKHHGCGYSVIDLTHDSPTPPLPAPTTAHEKLQRLAIGIARLIAGEDSTLAAVAMKAAWGLPDFESDEQLQAAVLESVAHVTEPPPDGLYHKYAVRRTDGSDGRGGKHEGCRYFVLDLTHDKYARDAILGYAQACEKDNAELASDLREASKNTKEASVDRPEAKEPTEEEIKNEAMLLHSQHQHWWNDFYEKRGKRYEKTSWSNAGLFARDIYFFCARSFLARTSSLHRELQRAREEADAASKQTEATIYAAVLSARTHFEAGKSEGLRQSAAAAREGRDAFSVAEELPNKAASSYITTKGILGLPMYVQIALGLEQGGSVLFRLLGAGRVAIHNANQALDEAGLLEEGQDLSPAKRLTHERDAWRAVAEERKAVVLKLDDERRAETSGGEIARLQAICASLQRSLNTRCAQAHAAGEREERGRCIAHLAEKEASALRFLDDASQFAHVRTAHGTRAGCLKATREAFERGEHVKAADHD